MAGKRATTFKHRGRPRKEEYLEVALKEKQKRTFPLPSCKELEAMAEMDIRDVDKEALVDLETVNIDPSLDCAQWQKEFIRQTGNPFFVKILGYPVRMTI